MTEKIDKLRWGLNNRQHGEIHKETVKELSELLTRTPYRYYSDNPYKRAEDILTGRRALNCTDGFYTDDEVEYRRKLIEKYKKMSKEGD